MHERIQLLKCHFQIVVLLIIRKHHAQYVPINHTHVNAQVATNHSHFKHKLLLSYIIYFHLPFWICNASCYLIIFIYLLYL